jgi:hypothetical protein
VGGTNVPFETEIALLGTVEVTSRVAKSESQAPRFSAPQVSREGCCIF